MAQSLEERLEHQEALLQQIAAMLGLSDTRPIDPQKAGRWNVSLLSHISELRDSIHTLNGHAQALNVLFIKLDEQLRENAAISTANKEGIRQLSVLSQKIEANSFAIIETFRTGYQEKPLLMRDLLWLETNSTEIWLFLFGFGEAIIFMVGDQKLRNSAMFRSLSTISADPSAWGIGLGLMSLCAAVAFISRRRASRRAAAFVFTVYFGVTGLMPLFMSPGVLGWWPHLLAFTASFWVLARGPSQAVG